jgi:hypothetical protein
MLGLRRKGQGMDVSRRPRRLSREDSMAPDRNWNNEPDDDAPAPDAEAVPLRRIASIGGAAQALFWIFFAFYVSYHANPRGDGMEWLAMMPATFILVVFVRPASCSASPAAGWRSPPSSSPPLRSSTSSCSCRSRASSPRRDKTPPTEAERRLLFRPWSIGRYAGVVDTAP